MKVLEGTWDEIAARAPEFRGRRLRVEVLPKEQGVSGEQDDLTRPWTARELMRLPRERRSRILRHQAEMAVEYYRTDPEVQEWEKLEAGDIYDETP